jgi:hypothetical protein
MAKRKKDKWKNNDLQFRLYSDMVYGLHVFMSNDLRWDVVVCFVYNGGIVDHNWLNFLFVSSKGSSSLFCKSIFILSDT